MLIIQNFSGEHLPLRNIGGKAHECLAMTRGHAAQIETRDGRFPGIKLLAEWAAKAKIGSEAVLIHPQAMVVRGEIPSACAGRDLAMLKNRVGAYSWFSTDVIFARKRSQRLQEFFERLLCEGPMLGAETLPVAGDSEIGGLNVLLPSSGMNVTTLGGEYCGSLLQSAPNPYIRSWRGCGVDFCVNQMKQYAGG